MTLKLIYSETSHLPVHAAFIEGSLPEQWLAEINRWGILFRELECYVLPESLRSVQAAGLLVVFKNDAVASGLDIKTPYIKVAERLYIPVHTSVYPEIGAHEWDRLLSWDVQVLHPNMGLAGFHYADQLDPMTLLADAPSAGTDWSLAHPGLPAKPPLKYIEVRRPSPQEIINSIREDMDTQPLRDIPKEEEDEPTPLQKALDDVKRDVIKGTLNTLEKLGEVFPDSGNSGSGWLNKFQDWLERNLAELERRRNNELQRLVNLFDKNSDEALKYAIPLDDTYAPRGTAPPSWKLGLRSTNFDLNRIGGGGPADTWDAGAYYNDLRTQYQRAAEMAIHKGDFRKAAYIYAHLLSNFHLAANVLKQGGHYREAAVLYKDHLKNLPAAAECLEQGGYYQEAAEVYETLYRFEKAGDLYLQIGQAEKAAVYFEKSLKVVLNNADHLDGARIAHDKLRQPERANEILLQGWEGNKQAEPCLKKYFDRTLEQEPEKTRQRLQEIFEQQTPPAKQSMLLNVLLHLNELPLSSDARDASRSIAYEIVSKAADRGDLAQLKTLPKFLPADRLLAADTSRFIHHQKKTATLRYAVDQIQLDSSIQWLNAASHRNQFLAAGFKNGRLHLARGNWQGQVEYYTWEEPVYDNPRPAFILNQYESPYVFIRCSSRPALGQKVLPKGKHFDSELIAGSAAWLQTTDLGLCINNNNELVALVDTNDQIELHYYSISGELQRTVTCTALTAGELPHYSGGTYPGLMLRGGMFYSYIENCVMRINGRGHTEVHNTHWRIRQLCMPEASQAFQMVALTDNGCALIRPNFEPEIRDTDFFARNFTPVTGAFLTGGRFVVASHNEVKLFRVDDSGASFMKSLETGTDVQRVAVLPTANRDRCAVLNAKGEIRVYEV